MIDQIKTLRLLALSIAFLTCITAKSQAAVITFEGSSGFASSIGSFIDVSGYRFTLSAGTNGNGFEVVATQNDIVEPGTTKLFAANHCVITMTRVGGGAFDLLSLDVGGSFVSSPGRWASSVDVSDGTNTINVVLPSNDPTYQAANPNFLGITSVFFTPFVNANQGSNNFEYTLDNIEVSAAAAALPVPEPASLALWSLGAIGCAFAGYRRRKLA